MNWKIKLNEMKWIQGYACAQNAHMFATTMCILHVLCVYVCVCLYETNLNISNQVSTSQRCFYYEFRFQRQTIDSYNIHATDREYITFNTSFIPFFLIYNFCGVVVLIMVFVPHFRVGFIFLHSFFSIILSNIKWLCLNINSALHCIWLRYDVIIIFEEKWKNPTQTAQFDIFRMYGDGKENWCETCLFLFSLFLFLLGIRISILLCCDIIAKQHNTIKK